MIFSSHAHEERRIALICSGKDGFLAGNESLFFCGGKG